MKKEDGTGDLSYIYAHLDKSGVLQEARVFNETPIKPSKCCLILSKVLFLMQQGEPLHTQEATDLFFSVTKLFQSKDTQLRKMVYLVIKELSTVAQDVIMATSSLTKDMNDRVATEIGYKSNAVRTLCTITDASMVQAIERFIKQAIVDKDANVSTAALVSSVHLYHQSSREVVKRWVNEAQEAVNRPAGMVQYLALGLLYQIRQQDKMAVSKIIQTLARGNSIRSPFAYVMMIRYTYRLLEDDGGLEGPSRGMYSILEMCLRHRHEMVNLEAARAICSLTGVTSKELVPAISVLQLFLNSPKATLRFSSLRTLSKLAVTHPATVAPCNLDMENLLNDSNRSIATFAITTLLKTGNEASVDRLMKQISSFMSEISDEFKVIIADAIRALCLKFPSKQAMMLQFLSASLRDEGGYEFKKAVVEGIFDIVASIPESKDIALSQLCEFIEDCEYTRLAVRILHLLGEEGPKMPVPSKYIRYIYNRTIIENSPVRAAAVSALAKFAASLGGDICTNIKILLTRCLDDADDEVRDRAVMYLKLLEEPPNEKVVRKFILDDSTFALSNLEAQLAGYVMTPNAHVKPFNFDMVPVITRAQEAAQRSSRTAVAEFARSAGVSSSPKHTAMSKPAEAAPLNAEEAKMNLLNAVPQFKSYGPLFRSCKRVELTETDIAEYVVSVVKHVFSEYIVFQFDCKNTLDDVLLENASVNLVTDDPELAAALAPAANIPIPVLKFNEPASAYVAFKKTGDKNDIPIGTFSASLNFLSKDCDPTTGEPDEEGYDDIYQLEDVEVAVGDFAIPAYTADFKGTWEDIGADFEMVETFQLPSLNTIADAIREILNLLPLSPCERSDELPRDRPASTITSHVLLLSGLFIGGVRCAVRIRMACVGAGGGSNGVTMELAVRSDNELISKLVAEVIG